MKIKVKRNLSINKSSENQQPNKRQQASAECQKFLDACRKTENDAELFSVMEDYWERIFGGEIPVDVELLLVKEKISYKLLYDGFIAHQVPISASMMKRYEASQKFDINNMSPITKVVLHHNQKGEDKMKVLKKKVTIKKRQAERIAKGKKPKTIIADAHTNGKPVAQTWIEVLSKNVTSKLKDKQLAEKMTKLCGVKRTGSAYTEADVRTHRGLYNHGKIKGQKGAPKTQLKQF